MDTNDMKFINAIEDREIFKDLPTRELQKLVNSFDPKCKTEFLIFLQIESELKRRFEDRVKVFHSRSLVRFLGPIADVRTELSMSKIAFRMVLIEELISRHPEARAASDEWERVCEESGLFKAGVAGRAVLIVAAVRSIL